MIPIPNDYKAILALGALAFIAYWMIKRDITAGVRAVGTAINPLSDRNVAYRSVNAVGEALTGTKDWSLGSSIYDLFNQDANLESDRRARELLLERRAYNYGALVSPTQPVDKPTAYIH